MYTEEYERRTFPIRDFLLKLIVIAFIIVLMIWLLPKFLQPNTTKVQDLSPLTDQIFADNLERMKDAGISYYTNERLPKKVGDSDKLTLREMISKKLLVPFVDKNGKACSVDKSYIKITKMDDEYLLKVNLKCSDDEDYILVHLGCYTYCEKDICEKKETVVAQGGSSKAPTPVPNIPTPSSKENEKKPSPTVPVEPSNPTKPTPSDNPSDSPKDPQEPGQTTPTEPVPQQKMEYEYKKTTGAVMSNWTNWSTWAKNTQGYQALDCNDSDPTCVKKIQLFSRKEQIGTYKKAYVSEKLEQRAYGSYQELACADYDYVRINETTYTTTNYYGTVSQITSSTQGSVGAWNYVGTYDAFTPPMDTATKKYVRVGYDFTCAGCSGRPKSTYKVYEYQGKLTNVTKSTSSTEQLLSSSTVKKVNTSINVSCSRVVTKTIPVYKTITVYEKAYNDEPLYGTVTYYSQKTRTVKQKGKTVTKWSSSSNDKSLIAQGYYYTGNSRKKQEG